MDCPFGYYQDFPGKTRCKTCSHGAFAITTSKCQDWAICGVGTYISFNGNRSHDRTCKNCSQGMFGNSQNKDKCEVCPRGTFSLNTTYCQPCPIGTYGNVTMAKNQSEGCMDCPFGYYQDFPGKTRCKTCSHGAFAITTSKCQDWATCGIGTYIAINGNSSHDRTCKNCSQGTFGNSQNKDKCEVCPRGTFSLNTTYCQPCPIGTYGNVTMAKN